MTRALLLLLLVSSPGYAQTFEDVWTEAQREVAALGVEGDPFSISLDDFRIREFDNNVICGRAATPGCFRVMVDPATDTLFGVLDYRGFRDDGRRYDRHETKRIMRHEACHAILWALGDDRWNRYGAGHEIPPVQF